MAYITATDLLTRTDEAMLVSLADRDGDGVADLPVIDQAIAEASSEIDGYLSGRYPAPLSPVTAHLKQLCADIALYRLAALPGSGADDLRTGYEDAIKYLGLVAAGKAHLAGVAPKETATPTNPPAASFTAPDRRFSRDTMGEF